MNSSSRFAKSTKNLIFGFISQFIVLLLNFVVRKIFIHFLGTTYLGVNGLFANILSILSLAEMGFGVAMTFNLYKPLAEKNEEQIASFMHFYQKVYKYIGITVGILGLSLLPFLKYLVKNTDGIEHIEYIYLMFLSDSVLSYFFAFRRSILNADQKAYICSKYRYIFAFIKCILQIIILISTKNFFLYLFVQILSTFLENVFISKKVLEIYPFLKKKDVNPLSKESLISIKKDIGALMLSRISHVALNGTDNIIISAYTSVENVGLLSNYTLISGALTMIVSQVSSAITGSVGNYIASESSENHYKLFKKIDFMFFSMYAFCFICMFTLYNPFIQVFFGKQYIFSDSIVLVFCVNYLIEGLLQSLWTFRTTMGLFVQGKYRPLFAAVINIVVSIVLVKYLGVLGVLLGTTISRVLVNAWYDPYIIFKYGLKISPKNYYITYFGRICLIAFVASALFVLKKFVFPNEYNVFSFIILVIITVITAAFLLLIPFAKTEEFKYYLMQLKTILKKLKDLKAK